MEFVMVAMVVVINNLSCSSIVLQVQPGVNRRRVAIFRFMFLPHYDSACVRISRDNCERFCVA